MKINIELQVYDSIDNATEEQTNFLIYWDFRKGEDIVCEIIDGKLFIHKFDENTSDVIRQEISLVNFIDRVKNSAIF